MALSGSLPQIILGVQDEVETDQASEEHDEIMDIYHNTELNGQQSMSTKACCAYLSLRDFSQSGSFKVAAVAEWYRYRAVACLVTSSSPVPLKTRRVGQRCTLNLSRAEMSSRWCGAVVRRGGASSGVVHVTGP
ncbi:uncharacterized protein TNCV_3210231 [Trichonephila clavipes]|nr:uncharacterized protein TNCV_3210231 [Trichonephila clavipes]